MFVLFYLRPQDTRRWEKTLKKTIFLMLKIITGLIKSAMSKFLLLFNFAQPPIIFGFLLIENLKLRMGQLT
jgi:hypothetical protein